MRGSTNRPAAPQQRIPIANLTVGDALQMLVNADPRYSWNDDSGIVVIRPITAWTDMRDPLNQPIKGIAWNDITLRETLDRIGQVIYGNRRPPRPDEKRDDRRISIRLDSGTVMDLLNAVVRAHGELMWGVIYPVNSPPILTDRFILHLSRFDGEVFSFNRPDLPPSLAGDPSGVRRGLQH
jgi:hypothetical protein